MGPRLATYGAGCRGPATTEGCPRCAHRHTRGREPGGSGGWRRCCCVDPRRQERKDGRGGGVAGSHAQRPEGGSRRLCRALAPGLGSSRHARAQRRRVEAAAAAAVAARHPADETVESADAFASRKEFLLPLPDELKIRLVEDWANVTKQNKVCAKFSVFCADSSRNNPRVLWVIPRTARGLAERTNSQRDS
jgi:hypothetical protein